MTIEKIMKIISFLEKEVIISSKKMLVNPQNQDVINSQIMLLGKYQLKLKEAKKYIKSNPKKSSSKQIKKEQYKKNPSNESPKKDNEKYYSFIESRSAQKNEKKGSQYCFGIPLPSNNNDSEETHYNQIKSEDQQIKCDQQQDDNQTEIGEEELQAQQQEFFEDYPMNQRGNYIEQENQPFSHKIEFIE